MLHTPPRWTRRPWLARLTALAIGIIPAAFGVATVIGVDAALGGRPLVLRVAVSSLAGLAAGWMLVKATRWLSPLTFLLRLDLLLPDELPSRFRVALRAGTTRELDAPTSDLAGAAEQIIALAARISAHDGATRGHSERVRAYVDLIGAELAMSPTDADRLRWAALLHDVGKVNVDRGILNSPGGLDGGQWEVIRRHPDVGADLVRPLNDFLGPWVDAVVDHHERVDGAGYPAAKRGEEISLGGRIVAVADAYDVMTAAGRRYKPAMSPAEAREELVRCTGGQFDRDIVRAFLRIPLGSLQRRSLFTAAAATLATASANASVGLVGAHLLPDAATLPSGASPPSGGSSSPNNNHLDDADDGMGLDDD